MNGMNGWNFLDKHKDRLAMFYKKDILFLIRFSKFEKTQD